MNDDILKMAQEAGFTVEGPFIFSDDPDNNIKKELTRLVALVRAAEQDRCCRIIYGMAGSDNVAQRTVEKIRGKE